MTDDYHDQTRRAVEEINKNTKAIGLWQTHLLRLSNATLYNLRFLGELSLNGLVNKPTNELIERYDIVFSYDDRDALHRDVTLVMPDIIAREISEKLHEVGIKLVLHGILVRTIEAFWLKTNDFLEPLRSKAVVMPESGSTDYSEVMQKDQRVRMAAATFAQNLEHFSDLFLEALSLIDVYSEKVQANARALDKKHNNASGGPFPINVFYLRRRKELKARNAWQKHRTQVSNHRVKHADLLKKLKENRAKFEAVSTPLHRFQ